MDQKFLEQMALSWLNDCRSDTSMNEAYLAGFEAAQIIYLARIERLEKLLKEATSEEPRWTASWCSVSGYDVEANKWKLTKWGYWIPLPKLPENA